MKAAGLRLGRPAAALVARVQTLRAVTSRVPAAWRAALLTSSRIALAICIALASSTDALAATPTPTLPPSPALQPDTDNLIVVAVRDEPEAVPSVGGTPRAPYGGQLGYAGSMRAAAEADDVARDHGLQAQSAWTIAPLRWRCMLYRITAGADRTAVLAELARDPRVQLAQALNTYETLAAPYNDPYVGLQHGFTTMEVAEAQQWTQGDGVRVALIDTGVDGDHPDLAGRIASARNVVAAAHPADATGERHGTEMAGVIAANARNGIGIAGIAPLARLLVYRACWPLAVNDGASRCDSYTLAQAMSAAISAGADIINLSVGGPADGLLQRLAERAMQQGTIVVGAVPPSGRLEGFPAGVPGVLAVAPEGSGVADGQALRAPGNNIITLTPGGHYDYASGSSLATAHVTGAIALLRALDPGLRADTARSWLAGAGSTTINVCLAVQRLRPQARCAEAVASTGGRPALGTGTGLGLHPTPIPSLSAP